MYWYSRIAVAQLSTEHWPTIEEETTGSCRCSGPRQVLGQHLSPWGTGAAVVIRIRVLHVIRGTATLFETLGYKIWHGTACALGVNAHGVCIYGHGIERVQDAGVVDCTAAEFW